MSDEVPQDQEALPADRGALFDENDDMLEPWEEEAPELELARARGRMTFRSVVFFVVTAVAAWCVFGFSTLSDFAYLLEHGGEPIDLGDLRGRRIAGETSLEVPVDSYVKLRNEVMTYEAESNCCEYFFDPLFNIITRTSRSLPEKDLYRSVEIPGKLAWLVEQRHAFAEDLTAGFDGEGRLIRADKAIRWRYLYDAYARTIVRMPPPEETWIFLDGDVPSSYWSYGVAYAAALLLVLLTGLFAYRAIRNYRRLLHTL